MILSKWFSSGKMFKS